MHHHITDTVYISQKLPTNGWDALLGLGTMALLAFACYGFYRLMKDA